jgi:hypothetical protein
MSVVMRERCHAMVGKRHAPNGERRCKHMTNRSNMCWQHLKEKQGFRIKKSTIPNAGLGLFTTKPIARDKKVTDYSGDKISSNDPNFGNPYVLEIGRHKFIDASKTNEPGLGRWINHKPIRQANTKFVVNRGKAYMKSTKSIPKDKELFVPYGSEYFKHFPKKVKKGIVPRRKKVAR